MLLLTLLAAASALDVARLRGPHPGVPAAEAEAKANEPELLNDAPKPAEAEEAAEATSAPVNHVKGIGQAAGKTGVAAAEDGAAAAAEGVDAASDTAAEAVDDIEGKMNTEEMEKALAAAKHGDVEQMARRVYRQMSVWLSIGGTVSLVIFACVWFYACRGSKRAPQPVKKPELQKGDFAPVGLCACCSWQFTHMCEALFCAPFMWAETAAKLQVLDFYALIALVCLALVLGPFTAGFSTLLFVFVRVYLRTSTLRGRFKQESTGSCSGTCVDGTLDCLVHLFCVPCAIAQEAEFVEHLETNKIIKV